MWVQRKASELETGDVVRDFGTLINCKPVPDRHLVVVWRTKHSGSMWPESALVDVLDADEVPSMSVASKGF
jgi:hypothetical protein